jgi:hypothetical protein
MQITKNSPGHLVPLAAGKAQAFVPGLPLDSIAWSDQLVSALSAADQSLALLEGFNQLKLRDHGAVTAGPITTRGQLFVAEKILAAIND